jgi:hypothetical protein
MRNRFEMVLRGLARVNNLYGSLPYPVTYPEMAEGRTLYPTDQDFEVVPLYGWRFGGLCLITPYCGGADAHNRPEVAHYEPWTSEQNLAVVSAGEWSDYTQEGEHETCVVAVTGPGTAWGNGRERPQRLQDLPPDTVLLVESAHSGIHWAAPEDFDTSTMPRTINDPSGRGISSRNRDGFCVGFADGRVWSLKHKVPFTVLEKFFTIESARLHDADELLGAYRLQ